MSTSISALTTAAAGVQSNHRALQQTAHRIASAAGQQTIPEELVQALVTAALQQHALEASANAVSRVDAALSALINATA